VCLTLLNFLVLVPGVMLPIYSITINTQVEASLIPDPVEVTVYEQTRSILGTVRELWRSADYLVSFLILTFSVIVPVTKGCLLLASIYVVKDKIRQRIVRIVDLIGKWSMADVFVVAVFLAYLATRDNAQTNSFSVPVLFQEVDVGMVTHLSSTLGVGFYYFLGYCLFSVLWTQLLNRQSANPVFH
jgi:paraquat-inducible protein A